MIYPNKPLYLLSLLGYIYRLTYYTLTTKDNIMDLIKDYDFILDCTDNFESKFLINDACVLAKKPLSHGAVVRFQGQAMTYVPGKGPCYRCVFTKPPVEGAVKNSKQIGVFGPLPGIIGNIQVFPTFKFCGGLVLHSISKKKLYVYIIRFKLEEFVFFWEKN